MQTRYLALGTNGKITYPLADIQMWCLPSAEFATLQGPKFDCFYLSLALYRAFSIVHESDTHARLRPLVTILSKRFLILSVITLHLSEATALSFSTRFYSSLFSLASVPDASAVVADLTASAIAEIPAAIADLPAAVTFTAPLNQATWRALQLPFLFPSAP